MPWLPHSEQVCFIVKCRVIILSFDFSTIISPNTGVENKLINKLSAKPILFVREASATVKANNMYIIK